MIFQVVVVIMYLLFFFYKKMENVLVIELKEEQGNDLKFESVQIRKNCRSNQK